MKKRIIVLLFTLCILFSLSANNQKYYAVSSLEWQTVNKLCHYAGVTGPTSNGPVTRDQLLLAIERAEVYLEKDNPILVDVKELLEGNTPFYADDIGSFAFTLTASPEVYAQTAKPHGENGENEPAWALDSSWFIKDHLERKSIATLLLENNTSDILYGRLRVDARQKAFQHSGDIWNENFHLSFYPFNLCQNFPFDAGVSLGGRGLSLIIARGKMSLGEGYTGNTAIGDNYDYQEFMKAGFYTRNTSIFLSLTSFDSSRNFDSSRVISAPWDTLNSKFTGYKNLRHSASYEIVLFDKLRFALSSVTMLDTDCAFDFRYLNPFMILHSMYNFHDTSTAILEANNILSLDISWAIARKWNLYAQISMDQFQSKVEAEEYINDKDKIGYTDPNALAGLLNISYTDILKSGIFNAYAEVVYTMPGMYLNTKYYDDEAKTTVVQKKTQYGRCWSQDFLVGYSREEERFNDMAYSGYKYGPDAFVLSLGGDYRVPSYYSIKASLFYMMHGEKGRGRDESNYTFDGIDTIETLWRLKPTGVIEHTFVVKVEGEVKLLNWLSLSLGAAFSHIRNKDNTEGSIFNNLQGYVGFTLSTGGVEI